MADEMLRFTTFYGQNIVTACAIEKSYSLITKNENCATAKHHLYEKIYFTFKLSNCETENVIL